MSERSGGAVGAVESTGPGGRPVRAFAVGLSADSLALAWARQGDAPAGATVLVAKELSARGRNGRLWAVNRFAADVDETSGKQVPHGGGWVGADPSTARRTLAFSVVLRPALAAEEADAVWLAVGTAVVDGVKLATDRALVTWWPDSVIDPDSGDEVAMIKAEVQLGPGQVRSAVVTTRVDLDRIGVEPGGERALMDAVLEALDRSAADLSEDPGLVAAAYEARCRLIDQRVKATLLPKGESRGIVQGVDRMGRLRLESSTGMVERITINQLRDLLPA